MTRSAIALVFCGVLVGGGVWAADEDPIGAKLATAKADYEKNLGKARDGLLADLKKKADVAQKAGDLKALEKVEDEVKAFEDKGTVPKLVSTRDFTDATRVARARLMTAYTEAVKEYTVAGKAPLAKAAQATLEELKKEAGGGKDDTPDDGLPVGTKLVGRGSIETGPLGKRVNNGFVMEWTVTKRSGKSITFAGQGGFTQEGTIVNGQVKLTTVDAPKDKAGAIDNNTFLITFDKAKGTFSGFMRQKTDPTLLGKVNLKIEKE